MTVQADNLPKGWVGARLDAFAEIILGQSPPSSTYNEDGNGLPFYQGKLEFGDMYPTPRKWCKSPKKIAEKGDVLVSVRAPVGPTNICPERSCIGRGLAAIRGLEGVETHFILYLMRAQGNLLSSIGTGTTFSAITGDKLKGIHVPLPPLSEQHCIVAKVEELFTRLDAGVEALKNIKTQLKHYRQSVLKHAFEGKLTAEWRQAHKDELEPASVLLERIKQGRQKTAKGKHKEIPPRDTSDLPRLPEGWMWARIAEISTLINGRAFKPSEWSMRGLPIIRIQNLNDPDAGFNYCNFEIDDRFVVENGQLLFAWSGTPGTSFGAHIWNRDKAVLNQHIFKVVIGENNINKRFLMHVLNHNVAEFIAKAHGTAGLAHITKGKFDESVITLPSLSEQHRIVEEVERRFSVADQIEKTVDHSLKQAERLRHGILKRAFEGKLVPQDLNDEPAEKLLERIKLEKSQREKAGNKIGREHKFKCHK